MNDELTDYYAIADDLINNVYYERNQLFQRMDDLFYSRWDKPAALPDWVLKVVSTDPHDAILTTVRTFSALRPHFKIMPMLNNAANRDRANQIETAVAWNFHQAGRRNESTVAWDVMFSASQYAEVAAQVVYLPYQERILEAMGKNSKRLKAAKKFGDFAFIIHNPANVYPMWSEYGLEGVLTVRMQTFDEFRNSWGNLAKKVDDTDGENVGWVTSYDYIDYEKRCVWGVMSETEEIQIEGNGVKILEEDNKLGFIPFAIKRWGNSLSVEPSERVMPLLQSVYDSGQWDMLNVFDSLDASLAIKRAAQVQFAGEFPAGQAPEIDNTEPAGIMELPPGTRNFTTLSGQSVDQRVSMLKNEAKSKIWQGTVAKALQSLEFPSGTSYSLGNQVLSAATKALAPYKLLGQNALAELAHQMLCWVKYYGKEYGEVNLYGRYEDKERMGQEVRISSDTIDPDLLQIEVILTEDVPVDKLQQINGAVLVKNNFAVPEAELIEELGYGDPEALKKRRRLEDYETTYVQTDLQRIQMQVQLEMQQAQMQMQMQAQQAAAQQQQQAAEQQMMMEQEASAAQNGAPANENLGGQGFNPNAGGQPPVGGARGQGGG